jgi:hypothetical protein
LWDPPRQGFVGFCDILNNTTCTLTIIFIILIMNIITRLFLLVLVAAGEITDAARRSKTVSFWF